MPRFSTQVYQEPILPKLLKTPRDLLILILIAIILIEAVALSALISKPDLLMKVGGKVGSSPKEDKSSRWQLYQNKDLGFEFMYPPSLTKDSSNQPGIIARFVLLEKASGKNEPVESMLISLEISPYQTPEAAASFIASFYQSDATSITNEQKTIGNFVPAHLVSITEDSNSPAESLYVLVKTPSNEILEIRMVWTGKYLDKYKEVANQILSTFKLLR